MKLETTVHNIINKYIPYNIMEILEDYFTMMTIKPLIEKYDLYKKSFTIFKKVDFLTWCDKRQDYIFTNISLCSRRPAFRAHKEFINKIKVMHEKIGHYCGIYLTEEDVELIDNLDFILNDPEVKEKISTAKKFEYWDFIKEYIKR